MPTPFTHLHITHQLLHDPHIPEQVRATLKAHAPDFLLGGVVADARPTPHSNRADTHFYHYATPMPDNPWREMLRCNPTLNAPQSAAHCAFITGYVAHLASDEYWTRHMLGPHFANGTWGSDLRDRFKVLHLLLIHMDERDEAALPDHIAATMQRSTPHDWLPFMHDDVIIEWRDFIAEQLVGESQTLSIFGRRIDIEPDDLRAMLDDDALMQRRLWHNVPPATVADLEDKLYAFSREQLLLYVARCEDVFSTP